APCSSTRMYACLLPLSPLFVRMLISYPGTTVGEAKNRGGSAPARPWTAEPCAYARETRANSCGAIAVGEHGDGLAGNGVRRECVLDEFRRDGLAGNQVHHADGAERHDASRELIRERRHSIHDDHRRIVKCSLDRRGARGGQRDIGGCE